MIFIGIGSNVGDRPTMLMNANQALIASRVEIMARSSVVETAALLPPGAPPEWDMPFYNQVVWVNDDRTPEALLDLLKTIEQQLGRQSRGHWGPREIDLDLLAYDDVLMETETLVLPHPRLHERRFVLEPLAEIAPHWQHPVLGRTAQALLAELDA